jgi:hypothetical protein
MGAARPSVPGRQRLGVVAGGSLFLASALGCMSLQFGGKTEVVREVAAPKPDGVYEQFGTAKLAPHEDATVYYPVPHLSPPNLTVHEAPKRIEDRQERPFRVVEQRPDRFRIENLGSDPLTVQWWTKGLRVQSPPF